MQTSASHPYMWVPCRRDYPNSAQLQNHFRTEKAHEFTYCKICDINFETPTQRQNNWGDNPITHHYRILCDVQFDTKNAIREHSRMSLKHVDAYFKAFDQDFIFANNFREVYPVISYPPR